MGNNFRYSFALNYLPKTAILQVSCGFRSSIQVYNGLIQRRSAGWDAAENIWKQGDASLRVCGCAAPRRWFQRYYRCCNEVNGR